MAIKKKDDFFKDLLKKFMPLFASAILLDWLFSSNVVIHHAKADKVKTKLSPLTLTKKNHDAITDTMERLIKGVNQDLSKRINNLVNENITERGSNKDLAKKLRELFDKDNPNYFNYKNRFTTISRTESTRVLSISGFNTAKRLGATKKYLSMVSDNRTGNDSKTAIRKYGSPEQAIPLDEHFEFTEGKKFYSYLLPPNRPNDREIVLYLYE